MPLNRRLRHNDSNICRRILVRLITDAHGCVWSSALSEFSIDAVQNKITHIFAAVRCILWNGSVSAIIVCTHRQIQTRKVLLHFTSIVCYLYNYFKWKSLHSVCHGITINPFVSSSLRMYANCRSIATTRTTAKCKTKKKSTIRNISRARSRKMENLHTERNDKGINENRLER